jgi:acetyl-CoA carboxylase alpha subunit
LFADAVDRNIRELKTIKTDELVELRYQKYRKIGVWKEEDEKTDNE